MVWEVLYLSGAFFGTIGELSGDVFGWLESSTNFSRHTWPSNMKGSVLFRAVSDRKKSRQCDAMGVFPSNGRLRLIPTNMIWGDSQGDTVDG